jgi:hypothetical protein
MLWLEKGGGKDERTAVSLQKKLLAPILASNLAVTGQKQG